MKVHTQARVTRVNTSEAQNLSDAKLPAGINIIRESEYDDHMVTTNKRWRESHVTEVSLHHMMVYLYGTTMHRRIILRRAASSCSMVTAASGENFTRRLNITGLLATRYSL